MSEICPTITAASIEEYERQLQAIEGFAARIHIDIADGTLAPRRLFPPDYMSWPRGLQVDLHVMTKVPQTILSRLINLQPNLVVVHAEANGDFFTIADKLHSHGIKAGVALLPPTEPKSIVESINIIDHVLIFSGNFGYQGRSSVNVSLFEKVKTLRRLKPQLEIGWDGGVNDQNVQMLARLGINVINVGSFIQSSNEPDQAYAKLISALG